MTLKAKLKYETPLLLEGFEKLIAKVNNRNWTGDPKHLYQLMFDQRTAQQEYEIFSQRAIDAIGKHYLPIYRMADGEFEFCLHKKRWNFEYVLRKMVLGSSMLKTCWGEVYLNDEYENAYSILLNSLKELSKKGILAMHFLKNSYYKDSVKMMDWFDVNKIEINSNN